MRTPETADPPGPARARLVLGVALTVAVALAASPSRAAAATPPERPSPLARQLAASARAGCGAELVELLADLVAFRTVHAEGVENAEHPEFQALTRYLERTAEAFGLDFRDAGPVVVIGLGEGDDKLGVVTHADVQPADASKWATDPFRLDTESEPGRLVGRGTEDDKGPLATALCAMRTVAESGVPLARRIELIVAYTEESDWDPFRNFLATYEPPAINIALDAQYPVVTAEKGWGQMELALPLDGPAPGGAGPRLATFEGGAFLSQVPESARAVVVDPTPEIERTLRAAAGADAAVRYAFDRRGDRLEIRATGRAAHSMEPWEGVNGITHLAAVLSHVDWADGAAARMVRLIADLVGTGDYAERFGDLSYEHPFMGRLTLTLATLGERDGRLVAGLSFRRPAGRTAEEVEESIVEAVDGWKRATGTGRLELTTAIYAPYMAQDAPHVPVLLDIFRHYTGREEAAPISIGGGTNARLLPNGVTFGPAMPGVPYSGHSEHEFITRDQLLLNLEMYTAMLVELAAEPAAPPR